jgi:hypothetical protein
MKKQGDQFSLILIKLNSIEERLQNIERELAERRTEKRSTKDSYYKRNKNTLLKYSRERSLRERTEVSDNYIKDILRKLGFQNPCREHIEEKRKAIQLKRKILEIERSYSKAMKN